MRQCLTIQALAGLKTIGTCLPLSFAYWTKGVWHCTLLEFIITEPGPEERMKVNQGLRFPREVGQVEHKDFLKGRTGIGLNSIPILNFLN